MGFRYDEKVPCRAVGLPSRSKRCRLLDQKTSPGGLTRGGSQRGRYPAGFVAEGCFPGADTHGGKAHMPATRASPRMAAKRRVVVMADDGRLGRSRRQTADAD